VLGLLGFGLPAGPRHCFGVEGGGRKARIVRPTLVQKWLLSAHGEGCRGYVDAWIRGFVAAWAWNVELEFLPGPVEEIARSSNLRSWTANMDDEQ
jgi:hypothetical protein